MTTISAHKVSSLRSSHPQLNQCLKVLGIHLTIKQRHSADPHTLLHDCEINFKRLLKQHHPDRGGDIEQCKTVIAAFRQIKKILFPKLYIPKAKKYIRKHETEAARKSAAVTGHKNWWAKLTEQERQDKLNRLKG